MTGTKPTLPSNERLLELVGELDHYAETEGYERGYPGGLYSGQRQRARAELEAGIRALTSHETCEQRAPVERALARRVYLKSERDMSGYRVVIGFDTLTDVQAAHQEVADIPKAPTQKAVDQPSPVDDAEFGTAEWRAANPESEGEQ